MHKLHLLLAFLLPPSLSSQTYAGAAACAACHTTEASTQANSHHAAALRPMPGSPLAAKLLQAIQSPGSEVQYRATSTGVEAEAGPETVLLTWAFGAGAQGITPVGTQHGTAIEHRFSAYTKSGALALTFGHPPRVNASVAALGILQDDRTIGRCFGCHSISQGAAPIELGVQCERCHGPGSAHIQAAKTHQSAAAIRRALFNPGKLPPKAQVEVCGACHRLPTPDSGDQPELEDPVSVRFAPVGLMASRCFRESQTLSCLTCHNPHDNARPATDLFYRDKCLTCHTSQTGIKHCRRIQKENCLPCHMQKASLTANLAFTNHRIRVP